MKSFQSLSSFLLLAVLLVGSTSAAVIQREKRQTSVFGDVNVEDLGRGTNRASGVLGVDHTAGSHTVSGSVHGSHTNFPGGSSSSAGVGGGYSYNPSDDTSVSLSGSHTRDLGGNWRQNSGSLSVSHNDGRHSLSAGVEADRTSYRGFGSETNVGGVVGYEYKPNRDTSLSISGSTSNGGSGFLNFNRRFR